MNLFWQMILPLLAGFILDLILGDPVWLYHPVRMIGFLIIWTEKIIRGCLPDSKCAERLGGALLVIIVVSVSVLAPFGILFFCVPVEIGCGTCRGKFYVLSDFCR